MIDRKFVVVTATAALSVLVIAVALIGEPGRQTGPVDRVGTIGASHQTSRPGEREHFERRDRSELATDGARREQTNADPRTAAEGAPETTERIAPRPAAGAGSKDPVESYEDAMAALSSIQESEVALARSALREDPSLKWRMISRKEAVELSRDGVLFLSGHSSELGGVGYFAANATQAEELSRLQADALEVFSSRVYVDAVSERLMKHFRDVIGESGVMVRFRNDGFGLEVVDGSGDVRASHLFHVPGYVL